MTYKCFVPGCKTGYSKDRKERKSQGRRTLTLFRVPRLELNPILAIVHGVIGSVQLPVEAVTEGKHANVSTQGQTDAKVQKDESFLMPCKDRLASLLDRENPNAKVRWVHNGRLVEADNVRIKLENSGDLKVVKAATGDNGLWWCSVALTPKISMTVSFAAVAVQNNKPDIVVELGEAFEMKCLATSLSRLVKSRMDQKWIHNSSTFRHLTDVRPERKEILKIYASNFSNSGIWNCRYSENSGSREWVTNVIRIFVIPPRTLLQKILPVVIAVSICLTVIAVVGSCYWKRLKKKKLVDLEVEDDEDEDEDAYKYEYDEGYGDDEEPTPLFADKLRGFENR